MADAEAVQKSLARLKSLDLYSCPVTELPNYKEKMYEMFPKLQVLDGFDRSGHEVDEDAETGCEDDEESDGDDDSSSDGSTSGEAEQDDGEKNADEDEDEEEGEGEEASDEPGLKALQRDDLEVRCCVRSR